MGERIFTFLFLTLLLILPDVNSVTEDRLKQEIFNFYKNLATEAEEITNEHVTPEKIKYFLFTTNNPDNYIEIDPFYPKELSNTNVRIVFVIHGWTGNREVKWYEYLKNAFLLRDDQEYYVVQVDWSDPAKQIYTISSWNTKDVGHIIGKFVVGLHWFYLVPLENILIVGHSLGGQVSGFVGKKVQELTGQKLPRIVALDPAGPLFDIRPENERLNKNDADVVHVIHTSGGTFGFKGSCGTIDFFPNGGSSQPGCTRVDLLDTTHVLEQISCDHKRSWEYFIEALLNPGYFVANKCDSYAQFKINLCDQIQVSMGDLRTREWGNFYLETNKDKPFGRKAGGFRLSYILPSLPALPALPYSP